MDEHLRSLSDAAYAFAEATRDAPRLLDVVARTLAHAVAGASLVVLLSDDRQSLIPAAACEVPPDALRQLHEAMAESSSLDAHPIARRVLESGTPYVARTFDVESLRPPATTSRAFACLQRAAIRSALVVPLRVHDQALGLLALARCGDGSAAFDDADLAVATRLATHAAMALFNARALIDARNAFADRKRHADGLRLLTEASREFATTSHDVDRLLDVVARRLGDIAGDLCVIRTVSDDGAWLEATGAIYHRDSALLDVVTRTAMTSSRQRVGGGISGRVAATGQPVLTPSVSAPDFVAASEPGYASFLARLGVTSALALPLVCRGKVLGVANLMRSRPGAPFDEDDLRLVQGVADHAALALGNARSFAAERAARDDAEKAAEALSRAETRFVRLSESGIIGILVSTLDGRVFHINDALLSMLGYARDEIVSGRVVWPDLTPPEWLGVDAVAREQLLSTGVGGLREKEYVRKDGTRVAVLVGSAMVAGGDGECISFVLDLTERRKAQAVIEQMRRERVVEARFRSLLESAPDAMVIATGDGAIALINGQTEALFGYARTALIGQPVGTLFTASQRDSVPATADGSQGVGTQLARFGRRQDGTEFPIEVRSSPIETESGLLVSHAIRDISERVRAEQQRASLAAIVESSADAIIGKTLAGVITSWNQGAQHIFGYRADETVGRSILMLIPPGREAEEPATLEILARGETRQFDTVRRRKDGRDIDVSLTISPVRDATGRVTGISKVARDITDRRIASEALARARDDAEAANRELEAFSYSVAHDLRAPLRGMNGFAQVLLDTYGATFDAEGRDWLNEILLNARKMGDLIDGLLSLARTTRSELRRERVELSAIVREVAADLALLEPHRAVELAVQDGLDADVDPRLARALVANVLSNAWKFTRATPRARVEFGATEARGGPAFFVRDNGAGFDMAFADKLFAPFHRLHTVDEFPGTGIGLATAQRIVHRHGGRIWGEGAVGRGATFYFTLPAQGALPTP